MNVYIYVCIHVFMYLLYMYNLNNQYCDGGLWGMGGELRREEWCVVMEAVQVVW